MNRINKLWLIILLAILVAGSIAFWVGYSVNNTQKKELQAQLKDLTDKEKRSAIERRISAQMEEIAIEQTEISDQQREEALQQTRIANEMRQQAELERRNAQEAEQNALSSEKRAVDASRLAESQRILAEQQREDAEFSRSVADTLRYLALARSLSSEAVNQENIGNHELASLLAYTSYVFTERYGGDVYQTALFEAVSMICRTNQTWKILNGAVMKIDQFENDEERYVCISTYGELCEFRFSNSRFTEKILFSNKNYDFRDFLLFPNGMIYVVSRTGDLLMFNPNGSYVLYTIPEAVHPFRLYARNNTEIAVVAENGIFIIEMGNLKIDKTIIYDSPINIIGRRNGNELMLFDKTNIVRVLDLDDLKQKTETLSFKDKVFSYNSLQDRNIQVYGTIDGTIIVLDDQGNINRLVGHQSRVSRISWVYKSFYRLPQQNMIISSSYDGTIKLWDLRTEKIEPINVFSSNSWVVCYRFENTGNYLWTGGQNGTISHIVISVPLMAETILKSLKRDFTIEEWEYYIGNNIPYESYLGR